MRYISPLQASSGIAKMEDNICFLIIFSWKQITWQSKDEVSDYNHRKNNCRKI